MRGTPLQKQLSELKNKNKSRAPQKTPILEEDDEFFELDELESMDEEDEF